METYNPPASPIATKIRHTTAEAIYNSLCARGWTFDQEDGPQADVAETLREVAGFVPIADPTE